MIVEIGYAAPDPSSFISRAGKDGPAVAADRHRAPELVEGVGVRRFDVRQLTPGGPGAREEIGGAGILRRVVILRAVHALRGAVLHRRAHEQSLPSPLSASRTANQSSRSGFDALMKACSAQCLRCAPRHTPRRRNRPRGRGNVSTSQPDGLMPPFRQLSSAVPAAIVLPSSLMATV